MLKLRSTSQTARVMLEQYIDEIRESSETIARDEARLSRVDLLLQSRKEQTLRQVAGFLRGIEQACVQAGAEGAKLLQQKLSFWRTLGLIWNRKQGVPRDFQSEIEAKLKQTVQPQVEQAVRLLEADLRGLWPQLHDMIDQQLGKELRAQIPKTSPDFARQRRELLQSIQLTLVERAAGKSMEDELSKMFQEASTQLRVPAGGAAPPGVCTTIPPR